MAYGALTAFLPWGHADETPEQLAKRKTAEWREMPEAEMEDVLVDLFTRVKGLLDERDGLKELIPVAVLLLNNSELCVAKHHGIDLETEEAPGWLADAKETIRRARAAYEGKDNG
jgi:hypothetical protein